MTTTVIEAKISPRAFPILSDADFTFAHNGSFIQIDAGKEWPFNAKREIVFRFKTKSPHGLLIYQTFDHNKLNHEEDSENIDLGLATQSKQPIQPNARYRQRELDTSIRSIDKKYSRDGRSASFEDQSKDPFVKKLVTNAIAVTASEKLVNSLFSSSPAAAINGNSLTGSRSKSNGQTSNRDGPLSAPGASPAFTRTDDTPFLSKGYHRVLGSAAIENENPPNRVASFAGRDSNPSGSPTVLSSSAINSLSASLYELYLKLENGRLKIMYEFGSRLNQTYCGKGLNDDRWHKIDLRVDPELNQMVLILDQVITVEIALSQSQQEEDSGRGNELVFTNSILYMGGLNNNALIVKNVKQRSYLAQFIGCIGQIMIKTDQQTEVGLQPVGIDRHNMVQMGCLNRCNTNNYCLHKTTCINYYSHTKCDCFGSNYEDTYCWKDNPTSLTMLGYSTLVYRIYDWRDRHHSSYNRLSLKFKTMSQDSVLFFAHGDLNAQNIRTPVQTIQVQPQVNLTSPMIVHRPAMHPLLSNINYLTISLANGSAVIEVNFGDQPIVFSNLMNEKLSARNQTRTLHQPYLSDNRWHNITFVHNSKQLHLYVDDFYLNHSISGKNYHLYFDPSIYVGGTPNVLLNETRSLSKPFNLRHKFVGCLKSVYFNQHDILLALKKQSSMVDYRDPLGKPKLDSCVIEEPNSLPLTLRSGKSYLTFQLAPNSQTVLTTEQKSEQLREQNGENYHKTTSNQNTTVQTRKLTKIEFEYKTSSRTHFLAGGHLRDLSYHDLGGFWTLHAREDCQLFFTVSSGLTYEPEQVIQLETTTVPRKCEPDMWNKVAISIVAGEKILNITRYPINDSYNDPINGSVNQIDHKSYILRSSVEFLHQVQLGGDLAKFGESSSVPFTGCIRRIKINDNLFDSRDLVSNSIISPSALNQQNVTSSQLGPVQSDYVSGRIAQGYVTLDSCSLVNPCSTLNPCKNNGTCKVNELGEPDCDCSKTGYTGKRCHFSIYKQSCSEIYLSGQRKSSHYLIDLDRNGPMKPIRVRCNMDKGESQIETSLSHNLPPEYLIRRSTTKDFALNITYLAFHHLCTADGFYSHDDDDDQANNNQNLMLKSLIEQSTYCEQHFKFECRSSILGLGRKTWAESAYPKVHKIFNFNASGNGMCPCAISEKKCLDPAKNCNCDSGDPIWTDDSFDLKSQHDVGLIRIVLMRQDSDEETNSNLAAPESQSRFTLSDLQCYGFKEHESQQEITFKTSDAYIEVPGWRRGDISFSFRTASNPPAIILYQLASSRNHGYFRLTLMSDVRLMFEFIVNRRPRKLFLTSVHKLNNGQWQQVFIEYDAVNLRLTVNDESTMVDLDPNDFLGTFEGPLFIGGAPSKYLIGDMSKRNGFTGCFRGLRIDGRPVDLRSYLSPSMPTVIGGCQPSCTKNLCQNGGKCVEYWGSYECECSNPIAHSGNNCEINLNTNSITFVTQEAYYVQASDDNSTYPPHLIKNLLLNIRTYQETALIMYASDHLNNFIQLHKNGSSLVLSFNSNNTIVIAQVPLDDEIESDISISNLAHPATSAPDPVKQAQASPTPNITAPISIIDKSIKVSNTSGSGQPIQVKIERHRLRTTFYVNNNFLIVEKPMILLNNYTQTPWLNPELETVRPIRSKTGSKLYSRLFLANVDYSFQTRLPGFTGCVQGLSIDNELFDFNRAHLSGEFRGDYRIGCKMHCDSFPCKNQGICIENWLEDRILCRCDTTSYVGRLCDEDIAATFNAQTSVFLYHLSKKLSSMARAAEVLTKEANTTSPIKVSNVTSLTSEGIDPSRPKMTRSFDIGETVNHFEVSLAFSTDQSAHSLRDDLVQVIVLITRANSSKYFFLGLTSDGSLLVQEDYGNSMSLSRLIKRSDYPFNDGYRHMVKYARYNQSIQITVDYQTYLPTMSVISAHQASKFSRYSLIYIGTRPENRTDGGGAQTSLTNYHGCVSNVLIKIDNILVEPLSEAFGHNIEIIPGFNPSHEESGNPSSIIEDVSVGSQLISQRQLELVIESPGSSRNDKGSSKTDDFTKFTGTDTITVHDVEQGRCAAFKKVEAVNEKRSINEPRNTALLEPRAIFMDPPRISEYKRVDGGATTRAIPSRKLGLIFYCSISILLLVGSSVTIYAYILQLRYKSEKFRCDTPFFHRRESNNGTPVPPVEPSIPLDDNLAKRKVTAAIRSSS